MTEIFKSVLYQSAAGGIVIFLLLCIKPLAAKRFSAKWQYFAWLFAALFMLFPVQKLIPSSLDIQTKKVQSIEAENKKANEQNNPGAALPRKEADGQLEEQNPKNDYSSSVPFEYKSLKVSGRYIRIFELFARLWLLGTVIFLLSALASRLRFAKRKRKTSVVISQSGELEEVKKLLGIKRKIRLCISSEASSPMLAGILFPVIYLSARSVEKEGERLVLMHELVHFKHKDLVFKVLSLLVCAVHWFNPFAYILSAEISKACEIYCDETVTENLDENGIKLYMKTILDLAEKNLK